MPETTPPSLIQQFFNPFKPWELIFGLVFYSLGAGLARFNRNSISWLSHFWGLFIVFIFLCASFFLQKRFLDQQIQNEKDYLVISKGRLSGKSYLLLGLAFIFAGTFCLIILITWKLLPLVAGLTFLLFFTGLIIFSIRPFKFISKAVAEIIHSITLATLIPGFSFFLQSKTSYSLLLFSTFPIIFLLISRNLAISLEDYNENRDRQSQSITEMIGWRVGCKLHNIFILISFLLITVFGIIGQPWKLTWPGLLALPIGVLQIWQIVLITQGAKPRWKLLALAANSLVILTPYFISLSAWLR
jgi:1,4-dihydroxy-2-naphthoate octaprenyltransferase